MARACDTRPTLWGVKGAVWAESPEGPVRVTRNQLLRGLAPETRIVYGVEGSVSREEIAALLQGGERVCSVSEAREGLGRGRRLEPARAGESAPDNDGAVAGRTHSAARVALSAEVSARIQEATCVLASLPACARIGELFQSAGHRSFLAGGSVRDAALCAIGDRPLTSAAFKDIDVTVSCASTDEIEAVLEQAGLPVIPLGREFGTIATIIHGEQVELTLHRREEYLPGSRKPIVAFGGDIHTDLARRDTTVNAMAVELGAHPQIVDPFDGLSDLVEGVLRAPGSAMRIIEEDKLRAARAIRQGAGFGFRIDDELAAAITFHAAHGMEDVSIERFTEEVRKLLAKGPAASARGVAMSAQLGMDPWLFGELRGDEGDPGVIENSTHPETALVLRVMRTPDARERMRERTFSKEEITRIHGASEILTGLAHASEAEVAGTVRDRDDATLELAIATGAALGHPRVGLLADTWGAADTWRRALPVDGRDGLALGLRGVEIGAGIARVRAAFLADPSLGREEALALLQGE